MLLVLKHFVIPAHDYLKNELHIEKITTFWRKILICYNLPVGSTTGVVAEGGGSVGTTAVSGEDENLSSLILVAADAFCSAIFLR